MRFLACAAAFIVLLPPRAAPAAAQALTPRAEYALGSWTTAHGLPQSTVVGVAQDREGYLWVATPARLVRFDGRRFRELDIPVMQDRRPDPLRGLVRGPDGRLWILQSRAGVGILRNDRVERVTDSLPSGPSQFAVGRGDTVWLRRGAELWLREGRDWRMRQRGVVGPIRTLMVDASGAVWIGGTRGLARMRGDRVQRWSVADGLPTDTIVAIAQDARGDILVVTSGGLVELAPSGDRRVRRVHGASTKGVTAIGMSGDGRVWLGGTNAVRLVTIRHDIGGALRAEVVVEREVATGDARLTELIVDDSDRLWIASAGAGLRLLRRLPVARVRQSDGLPTRSVHVVTGDGSGGLWVAGGCAGLTRWRGAGATTYRAPALGLADNCVHSVLRDRAGNLWVGQRDYLTRIGPEGGTLGYNLRPRGRDGADGTRPRADVGPLVELSDGTILFATSAPAVGRIRGDGGVEYPVPVRGMTATRAWSMVEEAPGVVWVGQVGEVSRVERDSVTRRFQELDGIPPGPIRVLLPGREGGMWIAAYGGGLAHAGRDGRVRSLAGDDSLFDHSLSGVVRDHVDRLWILGDRGLGVATERDLVTALERGRAPHDMVVLGPADSMPEGNGGFPNAWIDDTHRLWLATIDGVASVDAGGLMQGLPPEPRIDGVRVDGTAMSWRDTVAVPAGRRSLEVDFAAPDLDGSQRLRLRYRLVGHDHGWVEAGEGRTAVYARVTPGLYRFEVRAANASGAEARNPASLVVRVQAAWWQFTWLRLLAAALLLYGTWHWGRAGMARLQARNMALQHEIAERVRAQEAAELAAAELAHAARLATAGELSAAVAHELNQPLAAILSNAQAAHAMLVRGPTNELPPTIDDIVRQARRAAEVVRSMRVYARKQAPELCTVDLGEVVEEALTLIRFELKSRGVAPRVSREPSAGPVEGDPVQLQQVVVNLALNAADAVRELPAERRLLDIRIAAADGLVQLDVCDAGPGLTPEALAHLFQPFYTTKSTGLGLGLSISRTIVETHGGTLRVQSRPGEGTVVRCTFPVVRP